MSSIIYSSVPYHKQDEVGSEVVNTHIVVKSGKILPNRMNCFSCSSGLPEETDLHEDNNIGSQVSGGGSNCDGVNRTGTHDPAVLSASPSDPEAHIASRTFTYEELVDATKSFALELLLVEGENGRIYKGRLESTGQAVAVKRLNSDNASNRSFLTEVLMLSLLHHPNIVNLIGYCSEGNHRLLVYEFMLPESLEDHLHDLSPHKKPLDWNTRIKIATGVAKALEYLHDRANPPVIHRNLKPSHILLGEGYHAKLSNFGLAKLGAVGEKTHVSTRVVGPFGYCDPEYAMTGKLSPKSDIYSFGVVLLELITGRKAINTASPPKEQNLVVWAIPLFKDRRKFPQMADPLLQGQYPMRGLYQALAVAAMCLQQEAASRPHTRDIVTALSYLASQTYDTNVVQSAIMDKEVGESSGYLSDKQKAHNLERTNE